VFTYLYLHGFASGPSSSKARYFAAEFARCGITLKIPRLDAGIFEAMTITSQLREVERAAGRGPVRLIGSSLGGWLAALYASRSPAVDRVVLLAPAFGFVSLFSAMFGREKMSDWERTGSTPVFHYGSGEEKRLRFGFYEDAQTYPQFPDFSQAGLILHGVQDNTVPVDNSIRFRGCHPNVGLVTLTSGHELTEVTERLWREMREFFSLCPLADAQRDDRIL
jgi:pimeloyl-ACP methyl ester carboxylesterase